MANREEFVHCGKVVSSQLAQEHGKLVNPIEKPIIVRILGTAFESSPKTDPRTDAKKKPAS